MFEKRILALEVGVDMIKVLQCRQKKSYLEVENFKVIPESEIGVEDGIILDVNKAAEVINTYIKKSKYKTNNLALIINSSEIITRTIRVEKMDEKDLDIVIKLKYEDYFLFDISNYQLSYKIIGEIEGESKKLLEILIVAAPKKLIRQLISLAGLLKLKIQIISIGSDTITHLFKEELNLLNNKSKEDKLMVIEISSRSIMLTIISKGVGVMNKTIFLNTSEAISKNKLGVEINRFLQFYYSRNKDNTIEKIYITGNGAYMENIGDYMENLLGIYCEQGINVNPIFLEYTSEFESCMSYFGNLLGLLFQVWGKSMILNLLPESYIKAVKHKFYLALGLLTGVITLGILILLTMFLSHKIMLYSQEKIRLDKESLKVEIIEVENVRKEIEFLNKSKDLMEKTIGQLEIPSSISRQIIDIITNNSSKNIRIAELSINPSENIIKIAGSSNNSVEITNYIIRLDKTDYFGKITSLYTPRTSDIDYEELDLVNFDIEIIIDESISKDDVEEEES